MLQLYKVVLISEQPNETKHFTVEFIEMATFSNNAKERFKKKSGLVVGG